jgi:hypothetical protein
LFEGKWLTLLKIALPVSYGGIMQDVFTQVGDKQWVIDSKISISFKLSTCQAVNNAMAWAMLPFCD